jgi:uncharacterized lipoprotein YbaY
MKSSSQRIGAGALALMLSMLAGCSTATLNSPSTIAGTAVIRPRAEVPDGAVFEVTFERRVRPQAAPEVVARIRNSPAGRPPFRFTLEYPISIDAAQTYSVRAYVKLHEEVVFRSRLRTIVLTQNTASAIRLVMRKPPPEAALVESLWVLTELPSSSGIAVSAYSGPHLVTHPERKRAVAMGGCNNMIGTFEVRGKELTFIAMPGNLMPCEEGASRDEAFHMALGHSVRWQVRNQILELLDAGGEWTARFARRPDD